MTKDKALKMALDALEPYQIKRQDFEQFEEPVEALRTALAQPEQEPVACERCKQLEEQAYDLLGKLKVANIKLSMRSQRTWAGLMRGVRVDGDTVVIKVKNGNDAARELCGALIEEMNK